MVPSRSIHLLREPAQTAGAPHLHHLRHVDQEQLAAAPLCERAPPAAGLGRRLPAAAAAPRRRPAEERRRRRRRRRVRPATRIRRAGATPSAATRARWARCRAISSCRRAPRSRGGRATCATGRSRRAASSKIAARKSSAQVYGITSSLVTFHVYAPRALMGRGGARAGCSLLRRCRRRRATPSTRWRRRRSRRRRTRCRPRCCRAGCGSSPTRPSTGSTSWPPSST